MSDVGKRGSSSNPIQRFLVEKPWFTPLYISAYLVLPLLFFVAPNSGLLLALEIYIGGLVLATIAFWFMPSRKLTRDERWHTESVLFPWPQSWPGWRSTEDLLKDLS